MRKRQAFIGLSISVILYYHILFFNHHAFVQLFFFIRSIIYYMISDESNKRFYYLYLKWLFRKRWSSYSADPGSVFCLEICRNKKFLLQPALQTFPAVSLFLFLLNSKGLIHNSTQKLFFSWRPGRPIFTYWISLPVMIGMKVFISVPKTCSSTSVHC